MCLATDYVLLGILLSDVRKDSECIHKGIQKERKNSVSQQNAFLRQGLVSSTLVTLYSSKWQDCF